MIDLHSHILPGVDDGSKNILESINILKEMENAGFDTVILTPHYIENSDYTANNKTKNEKLAKLNEAIKKEKLKIKVELSNEIFLTENVLKLKKSAEITAMRKKFLLIELPFKSKINNLEDILYEIKMAKMTPIIAHPERYDFVKNNPEKLMELKKDGVLVQCNYGSVIGKYGKDAKKTIKYLLKHKMVDMLGTDIHRENSEVMRKFDKIAKKIKRWTSEEYFNYLTNGKALNEN